MNRKSAVFCKVCFKGVGRQPKTGKGRLFKTPVVDVVAPDNLQLHLKPKGTV